MLTGEMEKILSESRDTGWVMEPQAKQLFGLAGLDVTRFICTENEDEAERFAAETGYPLVAKVVSPRIVHKSDINGVVTGIMDGGQLLAAFDRLSRIDGATGVIVEESVKGTELIVGAKRDAQFGPVILFGVGGTAVEIYKDVALRMAPLTEADVASMMGSIKARPFLEGYRGSEPVSKSALTNLLMRFSDLIMDLGDAVESIDLNPVICSSARCVIADARIILHGHT
jgi:acetate---CoA ligase (ADP-forming) subunit beta